MILISANAFAQKSKNLIVVTLDGYRWQELFSGADEELINNKAYNTKETIKCRYWRETAAERRTTLMPFFWGTIAKQGQVYGNRTLGNFVNVRNPYWISYPGYNELFTGYPDTAVNSNSFPDNPNVNVFEYLNNKKEFNGEVAIFGGWNVYGRIFNRERSKLPINNGFAKVRGENLTEVEVALNLQQDLMPQIMGPAERPDVITYPLAKEYLMKRKPRVLYLALADTDAFGHQGKYDYYLDAGRKSDAILEDLWNYLQSDPFYKDQTTLFITTDHGRGKGRLWTSHSRSIPYCDEIWMAAIGPDIKPLGEQATAGQLYQNQVAKTLAAILDVNFKSKNPIGDKIKSFFK